MRNKYTITALLTDKQIFLFVFAFLLTAFSSIAQITGVVNQYANITAIDISCNRVSVESPALFAAGNLVLMIQMKGAEPDETNTSAFGDVGNINGAGNYEYQRILSINGNDLYFENTILRTYDITGRLQLIYVPEYTDVTVTGTLSSQAWNGTTGGVIALSVSGTLTLNADINASGAGFKGGLTNTLPSNCPTIFDGANMYYYFVSNSRCAFKGEGIADFIPNKTTGRGKQVNGGGGGNQHNAGGGGGSNYSNGGQGGDESSNCSLFKTNASGGLSLGTSYSIPDNKLFAGGGGGGGDQDNNVGGRGGNGGGIVFISASAIIGNNHLININGEDGMNSPGDGGGGGGAGGSAILKIATYTGPLTITVNGGKGGNSVSPVSSALGPGGGGGLIWLSNAMLPATLSTSMNGGIAGVSYNNNTTLQGTRNAANGENGALHLNAVIPQSTVLNTCNILPVTLLRFTGNRHMLQTTLSWVTTTETNNQEFTLEKSSNGIDYFRLAIIPGAVHALSVRSYTYTDSSSDAANIMYYRLSQIDTDGTKKHLSTIALLLPDDSFAVRLYPNPCKGSITIESIGSDLIHYDLYAVTGERITTHATIISNILPLTDVTAGYYIIILRYADRLEKRTFIVQ